ncbi:MAG: hypothetical protein Q7S80_00480 [bacterium]|nr:hypothetical protein [bacterium]
MHIGMLLLPEDYQRLFPNRSELAVHLRLLPTPRHHGVQWACLTPCPEVPAGYRAGTAFELLLFARQQWRICLTGAVTANDEIVPGLVICTCPVFVSRVIGLAKTDDPTAFLDENGTFYRPADDRTTNLRYLVFPD